MTYRQYLVYVHEATEYNTAEEHMADYGFPADCPVSADSLLTMFEIIFAVSRSDFATLVSATNLTAYQLGRYYGINTRSATHWISGERKPPEYVIQLIGFAIISELPSEDE